MEDVVVLERNRGRLHRSHLDSSDSLKNKNFPFFYNRLAGPDVISTQELRRNRPLAKYRIRVQQQKK